MKTSTLVRVTVGLALLNGILIGVPDRWAWGPMVVTAILLAIAVNALLDRAGGE